MKKIISRLAIIGFTILVSFNTLKAQVPAPDFWIDFNVSSLTAIDFTVSGPLNIHLDNIYTTPMVPLTPPPPSVPGSTITFTVNTTFNATITTGGGVPTPVQAPATVTMKVTFDHSVGQTNFYDTEILQMDIQGGSLPSGYRFRESPTLQSLGTRSVSDPGTGTYYIDSFFDVFFDLSDDNGQNWYPSNSGSSHMTLQPNQSIPTMGTWGLIALSTLVLGYGVLFLKNRMV